MADESLIEKNEIEELKSAKSIKSIKSAKSIKSIKSDKLSSHKNSQVKRSSKNFESQLDVIDEDDYSTYYLILIRRNGYI